jgi:hypothetical protein
MMAVGDFANANPAPLQDSVQLLRHMRLPFAVYRPAHGARLELATIGK